MFSLLSRLIGRLTVGRKLALIYCLDLTTVVFISGILINEKYIAINFSRKEQVGLEFIAQVRDGLLAAIERDGGSPTLLKPVAVRIADAERRFGAEMDTKVLSQHFVEDLLASLPPVSASAPAPAPAHQVQAAGKAYTFK